MNARIRLWVDALECVLAARHYFVLFQLIMYLDQTKILSKVEN